MSKIAYLFGPTPGETPGEYFVRITDRDSDEVTRGQPVHSPAETGLLMGEFWKQYFKRKRDETTKTKLQ